ncbi:phage antirepressor KilAC domain-containing protein [Bacillus pseudomycoides]|uniref:phage antirepressor KilAC domain-containing protein n=1 Tax=Bacillus pseudomycoides TaxID=64104 RepID=UPI0023DB58CE|nr:phage antirepressor KilAC domain-containing protein [Bacillus pseudomycoides]MDF2083818.1 BRO family protein [Bacillus pseudomycoides]
MTNNLQVFNHGEFGEVAIVQVEGKAYFASTEVAIILGYADPHKAIKQHCKEDGWVVRPVVIPHKNQTVDKKFISEGNLYRLIARSRLESAEKFESWVFDEVLPTIRKTGGYVSNADLMVNTYFGALPQEQQTLVKGLFVNIEEQQKQLSQAQKVITEQAPKVEYADKILLAEGFYTTTEIAKVFGMSAQFLHSELNRKGIIYKTSKKNWVHNEKYKFLREQGFIKYEVNTFGMTMKWSEKGREWLAKQLSVLDN